MVRRELVPSVPSAYAAPPLTSIQLGEAATRALLEGTKLDAARLEEQTKAQEYPESFEFPASLTVRLPAASVDHRPFNVVGLVEGSEPAMKDEYIVIQSHLDGAVGNRTVEGDAVYNAADDNATGSAVNISPGRADDGVKPKRSIDLRLGQRRRAGTVGHAAIRVGTAGAAREHRRHDQHRHDRRHSRARLRGCDRGPRHRAERGVPDRIARAQRPIDTLLERVNADYQKLLLNRRFDTPESEFFYPRTDAGPYLERGVLTIGFTTGIHARYHLPADEARHLDPAKAAAIGRTVFVMAHALAAADQRPKIDKPIPATVLRVK